MCTRYGLRTKISLAASPTPCCCFPASSPPGDGLRLRSSSSEMRESASDTPILGAEGRRSYMGKFAVGSAWHCTGPSLDESLSSPRFSLLTAILLASVGSVEPLRESTSLVGVSPSLGSLSSPCGGDASSFQPRFLSILESFSSEAPGASISSTLGLGRTSTPAMAASCARSRSPRSLSSRFASSARARSAVSLMFLFSRRNSTAREDALSPIVSHTR
mmetsp:Transcript_5527/g.24552  ORF Transcript_5527/g.24552 Transcript_5527/m.24552 type:complete len:218 (-) Transcript_5527:1348-2001(-)